MENIIPSIFCDVCKEKLLTKQNQVKEHERVFPLESSFTCSECSKLFKTKKKEEDYDKHFKKENFLRCHFCVDSIGCQNRSYLKGNCEVTKPKLTYISEKSSSAVELESFRSCFSQGKTIDCPNQSFIKDNCVETKSQLAHVSKISILAVNCQSLTSNDCGEYVKICKVQHEVTNDKLMSYEWHRFCKCSNNSSCECLDSVKESGPESLHGNNLPQQTVAISQICNTSFSLFEHKNPLLTKSHSNIISLRYDKCNDNIKYKSQPHTSLLKHTDLSFLECTICQITFKTEETFKIHMNNHKDSNRFVCKLCKKNCYNQNNLSDHMMVKHSNKRPFECYLCFLTFKTKLTLTRHMVTHSDERPHKSNFGLSKFKPKKCHTQHKTTYSEKRPYESNICDSTSKLKKYFFDVTKHSEERRHKCSTCSPIVY